MIFTVDDEGGGLLRVIVAGRIDAAAMETGLARFLEIAGRHERIDCLYLIEDLEMPTMGAIGVEFRHFGRLLSLVPKMRRCALLSNQAWVRNAARAEGALIPGLTMRIFDSGDEAGARAWLTAPG